MLNKLTSFWNRRKNLCLSLITLAAIAIVLKFPHLAQAASTGAETPEDILNSVNTYFNIAIKFFSAWLWPVLLMIGSLLDNDLIFGGAMGERLLSVWVQIRNLVNVVFVMILLAIALYNVLGLGEEGGGLPLAFKTALPRFVIALIAVNFSFIGVKMILDFTNVITGAVFALPSSTITESQSFQKQLETTICGSSSKEVPFRPMWCETSGSGFNERANNFFSRLDRSNIAVVFAVRFGKAVQLKFIRDDIRDITQLGFNIIFNAVLFIVYTLSFIALFLVLLFRMVGMWVGVVMSPFMALAIVLPNLAELAGEGADIQKKLISNAIAPIKIGLVMSVGYIMLDAFQVDKGSVGQIMSSSSLTAIDPHALPTDISDLQQLMVAVATIGIIWKGVFDGAKDTFAGEYTEKIRETAQGAGSFIASLPKYAQVLPVGGRFGKDGRKTASMAEMMATGRDAMNKFENKYGGSLLGGGTKLSSEDFSQLQKASTNIGTLARHLKDHPMAMNDARGLEEIKRAITAMPNFDKKDEITKKMADWNPNNYRKVVEDLASSSAVRGTGFTANQVISNIESTNSAAEAVNKDKTPDAVADRLIKASPAQKAADPALSSVSAPKRTPYVDLFASGMPKEIILKIAPIDGEGKVIPDDKILDKSGPAKNLYAGLKQGNLTDAQIRSYITQIPELAKDVIELSGLDDAKLKRAKEILAEPAPGATPARQ